MLFILDTNNPISSLHLDLKSFGLNPCEWTVLKDKSQTYRVQSKEDQNFVFLGKVAKKGQKLKWQKLQLVSI